MFSLLNKTGVTFNITLILNSYITFYSNMKIKQICLFTNK